MKTKPRVWLNVIPSGRGTSLLSSYPALTNEMQVKFMKALPPPGKREGCEHQEIFNRTFQRKAALVGVTRTQEQIYLLFFSLLLSEYVNILACLICALTYPVAST